MAALSISLTVRLSPSLSRNPSVYRVRKTHGNVVVSCWSVSHDNRGAISEQSLSLLGKLGLDSETWIELTQTFGQHNHVAVGCVDDLVLVFVRVNC